MKNKLHFYFHMSEKTHFTIFLFTQMRKWKFYILSKKGSSLYSGHVLTSPHPMWKGKKKKYSWTEWEGEQSSVNTLGHNPHPATPPSSLWVLFWHSNQYTMFSARASSVGNRRKEKGWIDPSQCSDRLTNYKNRGGSLLTAASVAH